MNPKIQAIIESYVRSFVVALGVAYSDGLRGTEEILVAALIAIAGPAIRAINPKDPAFGLMADAVTQEITKLAKADKKKTK
jgi:hypothetical protein